MVTVPGINVDTIQKQHMKVKPEEKSYEAKIVVKDSDLDIAWIKIDNSEGIKYEFVDFAKGKIVEVGDVAVVLRRMGNHFGRSTVSSEFRIGGITSKPRTLYVPSTAFQMGGGLPVFSTNGQVIGLMITQLPDEGEGKSQLSAMFAGQMSNMQDAMSGLILPAEDVVRVTARAMEPRE